MAPSSSPSKSHKNKSTTKNQKTTKEMSDQQDQPFHVAIVGGGLVGSLAAVLLAKRGWKVEIFERRSDTRRVPLDSGRSINLALSVRGIAALTAAGVEEDILKTLIPMKGRMIHSFSGQLSSQPYGVFGECINSVDRKLMNDHLLDCAENLTNVKIHFDQIIRECDFDQGILYIEQDDQHINNSTSSDDKNFTRKFDLIIGADGAYSKIRQQLMRKTRMSYSQEYIDHGWCELTIPPKSLGEYAIAPDHLHIWPRQTFMMIALPNRDKSFTATLFMPWAKFEAIQTKEDLMNFFESTFPDAIPLIGRDLLVKDYFKNPKGSLISIKCKPYHYKHTGVIVGDAAHAMVPFYGQGMNCGFEDVLVLNEILTKHVGQSKKPSSSQMANALTEYSQTRHKDAAAMCDLALHNYIEMRSSVTKFSYLLRKKIESFLYTLLPSKVIPLYTMVSFSRIPYSQVVERWNRQTLWLNCSAYLSFGILLFGSAFGLSKLGVEKFTWDALRIMWKKALTN